MRSYLQLLLSTLIVYSHNMRVLHWKVTGTDFDPTHSVFDSYAEKLNELVDEVAEIGIQVNTEPVSQLTAIEILKNDQEFKFVIIEGNETFTSRKAFETADLMFDTLIRIYEKTYKTDDLPDDIVNKLQEHSYLLRKEYQYKNKMRLK